MDARYVNPFITATYSVFQSLLSVVPERGTPVASRADATAEEVTLTVGFTGSLSGFVMVGMSLRTADRIASAMLGQPVRAFDNIAASAIARLEDTLCTNACKELENSGVLCRFTPPTLIRGRNVKLNTLDITAITVPFETQLGALTVTIGLVAKAQAA